MQTKTEQKLNAGITAEMAKNLDLNALKVARLVCKQWNMLFGNHLWHKRLETISKYTPKDRDPSTICHLIKTFHLTDNKEFQLYPLDYYKHFQDIELAKCLISTPKLHEKIDELMLITAIISNPSLLGFIGNHDSLTKKICKIFFDIYSGVQLISLQDEKFPKFKLTYIRDYLLLLYQSDDLKNIATKIGRYKNAYYVYKTKTQEEINQRNTKEQLGSAFEIEKAYQIYDEYYKFCESINNIFNSNKTKYES